jgi:hypothetical protein
MQVLQLIHRMSHRPSPAQATASTRLNDLLQTAAHVMHRRSLVFVVSDFITQPGWEKPLAMLAQRHDVVAIRLYDPLEMELPDLGLLTIQDAETAEQLLVDTHDKSFRSRFAAAVAKREDELHDAFAYAGVDVLEISTEDDIVDALFRFSELRKNSGRLKAGAVAGRGM